MLQVLLYFSGRRVRARLRQAARFPQRRSNERTPPVLTLLADELE